MPESIALASARIEVQRALVKLEPLFVPGARLTFVMRLPGNPDATLVSTSDTCPEVIAALAHLIAEGRA